MQKGCENFEIQLFCVHNALLNFVGKIFHKHNLKIVFIVAIENKKKLLAARNKRQQMPHTQN